MLEYNAFGAALGSNKRNLCGERVFLGGNNYNYDSRRNKAVLSAGGKAENVSAGLCAAERDSDAACVISAFKSVQNDIERVGASQTCPALYELKKQVHSCSEYAFVNINSSGAYAVADGGAVILEYNRGKIKRISENGRIAFAQSDNMFAMPKIFIGLNSAVALALRPESVAESFRSEPPAVALERVLALSEIMCGGGRKSGFAVIAQPDIGPILAEGDSSRSKSCEQDRQSGGYTDKSAGLALSLLKILTWGAAVVAVVVVICKSTGLW